MTNAERGKDDLRRSERVSEQIMAEAHRDDPLRYFLVKEARTKDGERVMTLVKEYQRWHALLNFVRTSPDPLWLFAARIAGPMHRNTDLFYGTNEAYRWIPNEGFVKAEPPHLPYIRKLPPRRVKRTRWK